MSNARNLADVISGNYDVPAGSLDNVDLSSRVAKSGDTMTGNLNQVKSMTSQYDGIGVLMGSSTANTNRSATFLQHTYIDAGGNQGNYVYNHSLRQTDGAYIANVYTADYSAGVHSWYNPNGGLSGNTVMSIDNAGRVTKPYQPVFSGNRDGKSGIINTAGLIDFNPIVNTGSHWNTSTNTFTCPVAGRYFVSFYNLTDGGSTAVASSVEVRKNGSTFYNAYTQGGSNVDGNRYWNASASGVFDCQASDTITLYIASGAAYSGYYCGATIYLIG